LSHTEERGLGVRGKRVFGLGLRIDLLAGLWNDKLAARRSRGRRQGLSLDVRRVAEQGGHQVLETRRARSR
jgi:hypothetical protein